MDLISINIYRPPDSNYQQWEKALNQISEEITKIQNLGQFKNISMTWDFNLPKNDCTSINFEDPDEKVGNPSARKLLEFAKDQFLEQFIKEPTCGKNILDLIFSNNHQILCQYKVIINHKLSDHNMIVSTLNYTLDNKYKKRQKFQNV